MLSLSGLERRVFIASAIYGLGLCLLPVASVLGPESALALGLVLPSLAGALGADLGHRARTGASSVDSAFGQALARGLGLVALPTIVLSLNALRVRTCNPGSGLSFMLLGPALGTLLGACLGTAFGLIVPRRRIAMTAAVALPIVGIGLSLYRLYATPAVHAFGHFFGYFPGTLYDRSVNVPTSWLQMRGLSVVLGAGAYALSRAMALPAAGDEGRDTNAPSLAERLRAHGPSVAVGVGCLIFAGVMSARASDWDLRTSRAAAVSLLGKELRSDRCVLAVPRELSTEEAIRLAEDCDFEVNRLEKTLGVSVDAPITAFFFRDAAEKRRVMGAGTVYVAKPWRDEVYLQLAGWPHPVLAHELAHVVAGRAGVGPFRIAGVLGGYAPEPTLIEGMAVALAWEPQGGLTPHQWARAAQDSGVAPQLSQLMGAGFFEHNQALGYTLAGSFLRHVLEAHGAEALRETYRSGDVETATGQPLSALEDAWRKRLARTPLPESARQLAELRFSRPGVLSAVCPHEVERLRLELHGALAAGDDVGAVEHCEEILGIDPQNAESRVRRVGALARSGNTEGALAALQDMENADDVPRAVVGRAKQELADAAFRSGDLGRAGELLRELQEEPMDEAARRNLEVKRLALGLPSTERELLRDLLVGTPGKTTDGRVATHLTEQLAKLRSDGLGDYLLARQLLHAARYDLAERSLARALDRELPFARLTREARLLHGASAFAQGHFSVARVSFEALLADSEASEEQKLVASRWIDRVRHAQTPPPPGEAAAARDAEGTKG